MNCVGSGLGAFLGVNGRVVGGGAEVAQPRTWTRS